MDEDNTSNFDKDLFAERTNKLGESLDQYDETNDEEKRAHIAHRALEESCALFRSLSPEALRERVSETLERAEEDGEEDAFDDPRTFLRFLEFEERLLYVLGINRATRTRIIGYIFQARELAINRRTNTDQIMRLSESLAYEICSIAEDQGPQPGIKDARRRHRRALRLSIRALRFVVIPANAYGADYGPMIVEELTWLPEEATEGVLNRFFALSEKMGDALQSLVDEAAQ